MYPPDFSKFKKPRFVLGAYIILSFCFSVLKFLFFLIFVGFSFSSFSSNSSSSSASFTFNNCLSSLLRAGHGSSSTSIFSTS